MFLIPFATSLALAAPPDGVDLEDLGLWEARAATLRSGPAGCWLLEGTLVVSFTMYTPPTMFSRAAERTVQARGTFTGRFDEGRWRAFEYELEPVEGEGEDGIEVPVRPIMGQIDPGVVHRHSKDGAEGTEAEADGETDGEAADDEASGPAVRIEDSGGEAMSLLDEALDEIDPSTTTAYAQWSEAEGGVRLLQDIPLDDSARAETLTISTLFPAGGPLATQIDAVFPRRLRKRMGLIRISLYDAQMHLRGQVASDIVLPAKESVSLGFGALGFTIGYEQQLTYTRAVGCVGGEPADPPGE